MSAKKAITEPQSVPNYYAVIPASVRYDDKLPGRAALLYGEITALANTEGYCWASNSYFAGLYHVSADTIRTWIQALEARGHIKRVEIRDDNNAVVERRIYVTDPPLDISTPSPENPGEAPPKNPQYNITSNNNIPPYIPPQGGEQAQEEKEKKPTIAEQRTLWFDKIMEIYPNTDARSASLTRWLRLKPSHEFAQQVYLIIQQQVRSQKWSDDHWPEFRTWLKDKRWEDAPRRPPAQASPPRVRVVDDDKVEPW